MKIRTELLEYLVRQCVVEVLDQIEEEAKDSKLKSSGIGKGDDVKPVKQKIGVKPFRTGSKKNVNIKKLDESENPELAGDMAPPGDGQGTGDQPAVPKDDPNPKEPMPKEPTPEEPPQRIPKGAVVLNPKDKSRLDPIKWQGRDESAIERTLHQVAVSTAGPRTKVSLGAKRMAREAVTNPSINVFFYIGQMDPESDEVFLMADKSLQLAKDGSVNPGELTGSPTAMPPNKSLNYTNMTAADYEDHMNRRNLPAPRYGVDEPESTGEPEAIGEGAAKLIKKMVNQILDS
jgi:hypothetical protein